MSKKVVLYGDSFDIYEEGNVSDGTKWTSVISDNKKFFVFEKPIWNKDFLIGKLMQKEFGLLPNSFGVVFHRASKNIFISTTINYDIMKDIVARIDF